MPHTYLHSTVRRNRRYLHFLATVAVASFGFAHPVSATVGGERSVPLAIESTRQQSADRCRPDARYRPHEFFEGAAFITEETVEYVIPSSIVEEDRSVSDGIDIKSSDRVARERRIYLLRECE